MRSIPGVVLAGVVALAVGAAVGAPILGIASRALTGSARYVDPLLRRSGDSVAWLQGTTPALQTVSEIQAEAFGTLLRILAALASLVLAIALTSGLSLLLARVADRRPEMALRVVLGAGWRRLGGRLAAKGALLLLGTGSLALLIGSGIARLLRETWPGEAPPWGETMLDGRVLGSIATVIATSLLLVWLSPTRIAWRRDLRRFLQAGARATSGRRGVSTRRLLASGQIAASLALLTGAGLLLRAVTLAPEGRPDHGFDERGTLTVQIRVPDSWEQDAPGHPLEELRIRIAALPGVVDTSLATPGAWLGLGTTDRVTAVCPECWLGSMSKPVSRAPTRIHAVSPGFFAALGAPVLRGREIDSGDGRGAPAIAVVSQTFAYRLLPNGDPLGKMIQIGGREGEWYTIVGVVGEVRAPGIGSGAEPTPAIYLSVLQHSPAAVSLAVRAAGDPSDLLPGLEAVVRSAAPGANLFDAMTMEQYLARFRAPLRWVALVLGALTGVALLLCTLGLHSVMAHDVARRTREIGIRIALGARRRDITHMVARQSLRITATGVMAGLFLALPLARVLQLLVRGVVLFDPILVGAISMLLGSVALLASHRPAQGAASVDPQVSLRAR